MDATKYPADWPLLKALGARKRNSAKRYQERADAYTAEAEAIEAELAERRRVLEAAS